MTHFIDKKRDAESSASRFLSIIDFGDHAAADYDIPIVEDHGLAHGQGPDRLIKDDLHTAIREGNILTDEELVGARKTLTAAAMTYVAAVATTLVQILRLIAIYGNKRKRY